MRHGFSLLELSIVLVIIGLLSGGILGGQALIKAAELRTVPKEYQAYFTAVQSFKDKYFAIPGDMNNATQFWGFAGTSAAPNCVTNSAAAVAAPGTCDGNGNSTMEVASAVSSTGETQQFWKQLALAGLIEGSYTGLAGPNNTQWLGNDSIPGTNVPRSRFGNNAGWGTGYNNINASANAYKADYGNFFGYGALNPGSIPDAALLKPEDAWNIDTKMDDGMPGRGKIIVRDVVGFGQPGACTTSTSGTDYTGAYHLTSNIIACAFKFSQVY